MSNPQSTEVRLEPEHRGPLHVRTTLERLGRWLRDERWTVTVGGTTLSAAKHPGVLYRNLWPLDHLTRGTIACWSDGSHMHLTFRPDWRAALVDAGLLALVFALTRPLAPDGAPGSWWTDAVIAFLVIAAVLQALMSVLRSRFAAVLSGAVSSSDAAWERDRRRGARRRIGLNLLAYVTLVWLVWTARLIPWLSVWGSLDLDPAAQFTASDPVLLRSAALGFEVRILPPLVDESLRQRILEGSLPLPDAHSWTFVEPDSGKNGQRGQHRRRATIIVVDSIGMKEADWNEAAVSTLKSALYQAPGSEIVERTVRWRETASDTAEFRFALHDFQNQEFINWRCLGSQVRRRPGMVCVETGAPTVEALAAVRESLVLTPQQPASGDAP